MKMLALVALTLASASAFAQQKLGDLNFFQKQGSFYYQGSFGSTNYISTSKLTNVETKKEGLHLTNQLSYGVLNNLNVFAEVTYFHNNQNKVQGSSNAGYNDGFSNPGVGLNYRILSNAPGFLDVFGKVNKRLQDAERASLVKKDGNASGAADMNVQVGAAFGYAYSLLHEYRFTVGANHFFDGEYEQKVDGAASTKEDTDAQTNFFAKANYQYRPMDVFMWDFAYTYERLAESSRKNNLGVKTTYDARNIHNLGIRAKYMVTESILVSVKYDTAYLQDYNGKIGASNDKIKRQKFYTYALGLDLLF